MNQYPRVAVIALIINEDDKVLIGRRSNNCTLPYYAFPGGRLEVGETIEDAIIREVKEETNLDVINQKVFGMTDNLFHYYHGDEPDSHYICIGIIVNQFHGNLKNMEPHKCEYWKWVDLQDIPMPRTEITITLVELYQKNIIYRSTKEIK